MFVYNIKVKFRIQNISKFKILKIAEYISPKWSRNGACGQKTMTDSTDEQTYILLLKFKVNIELPLKWLKILVFHKNCDNFHLGL